MNKERGAILPLLAIAMVVIIGIAAWLVDLSRGNLAVDTIQQSVDAASLSAVRQFNGTNEGWENAKSVALLTLQTNPISGVPTNALDGIILNTKTDWGKNTLGKQNGLQVRVARGVYWYDDQSDTRHFVSLEDEAENGKGPWLNQDYSKSIFADAIQVELTLDKFETSGFAKVTGNKSFNNLAKTSVAVSDTTLDLPVFPGAIPYCQLMLNTDPNEAQNHLLNTYDPQKSSSRELYFTELEGFVTGTNDTDTGKNFNGATLPSATYERREGLRRYLSHVYMPVYDITKANNLCSNSANGKAVSCKNVPIRGLLGVYGDSPGPTTVAELKDYLDSASNGLMKVQRGQHFKPLTEWPADVSAVSESMSRFLETADKTIDDLYIDRTGGLKHAKANFPAVRHQQRLPNGVILNGVGDFMKRPLVYAGAGVDPLAGNRINWPLQIGDREYRFGLLLGLNRPPGDITPVDAVTNAPFINPMCNSTEENLDRTNYKVKRYSVMVIAPASDETTYDGNPVSYCDFANQFAGTPQEAKVPWWKNEPRVVGVVPIDFIGYNFEDLDSRFVNNTPKYSEFGGATIVDDNPGMLELGANFKPEVEQYEEEYNNCNANMAANPNACNLQVSSEIVLPTELSNCFDDSSYLAFKNSLNQVSTKANECESKEFHGHCDPEDVVCQQRRAIYQACLSQLNQQFNTVSSINVALTLPAVLNAHCLPLPKEDAYDFNSSNNYEQPLQSLKAGRGCGGVRARVSSLGGGPLLLNTGKAWSNMKPMLLENAD